MYAAGIEKEIDLLVLDMSGTDLDVLLNVRLDVMPPVEVKNYVIIANFIFTITSKLLNNCLKKLQK